jgi:hypothetical protein
VASENNPRKMERCELLELIALRQKSYKKAVTELRLADQTQCTTNTCWRGAGSDQREIYEAKSSTGKWR